MRLKYTWFEFSQKMNIYLSGREVLTPLTAQWHVTHPNGQGVVCHTLSQQGGKLSLLRFTINKNHLQGLRSFEELSRIGGTEPYQLGKNNFMTYVPQESTAYYHNQYPVIFSTITRSTTPVGMIIGITTVFTLVISQLSR